MTTEMIHEPLEITLEDAKVWAKHLARDMDVPRIKWIGLIPKNGEFAGAYGAGTITSAGRITLQTLLHEFAHHVHQCRLGKPLKRAHAVGFHRICFEIRDLVAALYGLDLIGINGYEHTEGFAQALDEWVLAHREMKKAA
jgi:hypothetical protein